MKRGWKECHGERVAEGKWKKKVPACTLYPPAEEWGKNPPPKRTLATPSSLMCHQRRVIEKEERMEMKKKKRSKEDQEMEEMK
jgi:hypothetical protein